MHRRAIAGLAAGTVALVSVGCANDAAVSAPTTVAEAGEAFLAAVYGGDTTAFDELAAGDLAEARFFSAMVVGLGGTTSTLSCEEPRPGTAACRVTGGDRLTAGLAPDEEVIDIWDLQIDDDLRVTRTTLDVLLPPAVSEFFRALADADPTWLEACGDFAADGDPVRCADIALDALEERGAG